MPEDKIGLIQLPNAADGGERFMIVYIDGQKLAEKHGYFRTTTGAMTEAEVRAFFEKGRQPANDVEAMFRLAREASIAGRNPDA
jgi:hypothetical protein